MDIGADRGGTRVMSRSTDKGREGMEIRWMVVIWVRLTIQCLLLYRELNTPYVDMMISLFA